MNPKITLIGEDITIDVEDPDFYGNMLEAIASRVFQLLGPEFDKKAYLHEVEKGRSPLEIGQRWAIPVSITLSFELGYCLGQLRNLGKILDSDKALSDLYALWKKKLKIMLREEAFSRKFLH
jgi:hypothetical protein